MMTKKDVTAWIERVENKALNSVKTEYECRKATEEERILQGSGAIEIINKMQTLVDQVAVENNNLIALLNTCPGVQQYSKNAYRGVSESISNLGNLHKEVHDKTDFQSPELTRLKKVYEETARSVRANYAAVKEEIKNKSNAARCVGYLKELGFDVSSLEAMDHTEIAVAVDKKYLFVCGDNK